MFFLATHDNHDRSRFQGAQTNDYIVNVDAGQFPIEEDQIRGLRFGQLKQAHRIHSFSNQVKLRDFLQHQTESPKSLCVVVSQNNAHWSHPPLVEHCARQRLNGAGVVPDRPKVGTGVSRNSGGIS